MDINYLAIFLVSGAIGAGFAIGIAAVIATGNLIAGVIGRSAD